MLFAEDSRLITKIQSFLLPSSLVTGFIASCICHLHKFKEWCEYRDGLCCVSQWRHPQGAGWSSPMILSSPQEGVRTAGIPQHLPPRQTQWGSPWDWRILHLSLETNVTEVLQLEKMHSHQKSFSPAAEWTQLYFRICLSYVHACIEY